MALVRWFPCYSALASTDGACTGRIRVFTQRQPSAPPSPPVGRRFKAAAAKLTDLALGGGQHQVGRAGLLAGEGRVTPPGARPL